MPNIVFTDYEESGAIGMQNLTEIVRKADVKHMRLMLSLDRQGVGEYVTYNKLPEQVHKYVKALDFTMTLVAFPIASYLLKNTLYLLLMFRWVIIINTQSGNFYVLTSLILQLIG
jgi:hypothetical protein